MIVVSTGEGPLVGPSQAGDEPVLLAGELSGVAVVVAERRHEAGRHALERLHPAPDLFLLDDGFSHLRLRRDIDLLAMPAVDPWGGGRLMPSGRLREPLEAVCRADAVVLTGADRQSGAEVAEGLRPYGFRGPGFISRTRAALPARAAREPLAPGSKVLVVTGIARPERFADTVRELGYETVGSLHFADHHAYGDASLARIREAFRATGADCVLTTAKDQVKLVGRLALPVADVPIRAEPEAAFWEWLDRRLEALPGFEAKR